jgi:hypothetical protein
VCSYRVKRRKRLASLGRAEVLILDQVRTKATAYLGKVASNEDPQDESDALRVSRTVADVVHAYVENHAKPKKNKTSIKKPSSIAAPRSCLLTLRFGDRQSRSRLSRFFREKRTIHTELARASAILYSTSNERVFSGSCVPRHPPFSWLEIPKRFLGI